MTSRFLAIAIALGMLGFVGLFMWGALRGAAPAPDSATPTATASETLSDGQLSLAVYAPGDRAVRLEVSFTADADAADTASQRPDVNLAMVAMHMDGISPPLESVAPGVWQSAVTVPMAGRWIISVGFGEEFAEVEFDVR